MPCTAGRV